MAETGLWAWSRGDSAGLALVLVLVDAFFAISALGTLLGSSCAEGKPRSCPSEPWTAVPLGLLAFTLVLAGLWLHKEVKEEMGRVRAGVTSGSPLGPEPRRGHHARMRRQGGKATVEGTFPRPHAVCQVISNPFPDLNKP